MRVAVVTPYYMEPTEVLQRYHDSVRGQSHGKVTHYLVADGRLNPLVDGWDARHIRLPLPHGAARAARVSNTKYRIRVPFLR